MAKTKQEIHGPEIWTSLLLISLTGIGLLLESFAVKVACIVFIASIVWLEVEDSRGGAPEAQADFDALADLAHAHLWEGGAEGLGDAGEDLSELDSEDEEEEDDEDSVGEDEEGPSSAVFNTEDLQHPRFGRLRCRLNGNLLPVNAPEPVPFETDTFSGKCLFLVRTEDKCPIWGDYLETYNRNFELQMQGKFKREVSSTLWQGVEVAMPLQMGLVTQAVAKAGLRFVSTINKGIHYSFGEKGKAATAPTAELPHVACALRKIMDRLVVTPEGQEAPRLGQDIYEGDDATIKARKSSTSNEFYGIKETYTFAFLSNVVDWPNWQISNVPGVSGTSLTSFIGKQRAQVIAYTLSDSADPNGKHCQHEKEYLINMELSYDAVPSARGSLSKKKVKTSKRKRKATRKSADMLNQAPSDGEEAESREKVWVRSGDLLPLVAMGVTLGAKDGAGYCCLAEGSGPAVLRQQGTPPACQLIKVDSDEETPVPNNSAPHLLQGDVVMLHFPALGKYLVQTSKYGRLGWVTESPTTARGHFYITGLGEGKKLTANTHFWLGSCSKANYQIGYSSEGSAKYGGRSLYLVSMDEDRERRKGGRSKLKLVKRGPLSSLALCMLGNKEGEGASQDTREPYSGLDLPGLAFSDLSSITPGDDLESIAEKAASLGGNANDVYDPTLRATVPAWIEIMHRRERTPQFAYLVCVSSSSKNKEWTCIRTGDELAPVIRLCPDTYDNPGWGQLAEQKEDFAEEPRRRRRFRRVTKYSPVKHKKKAAQVVRAMNQSLCSLHPSDVEIQDSNSDNLLNSAKAEPQRRQSKTAVDVTEVGEEDLAEAVQIKVKVPDGENSTFEVTSAEDGATTLHSEDKGQANLNEGVLFSEEGHSDENGSPTISAAAPSQEEEPSPTSGANSKKAHLARRLLCCLVSRENELDGWFLQGGSAEVGVVVPSKPPAVCQGMVCRAVWESHWREEWMVLYPQTLAFFLSAASKSKRPTFTLAFADMVAVEKPLDSDKAPLPGISLLKLHTLGRVTYLCFSLASTRDEWARRISEGVAYAKLNPSEAGATLWSDPEEYYALKGGPWKGVGNRSQIPRLILNSRRMKFDIEDPPPNQWKLSEDLLRTIFSDDIDLDCNLIAFLDECSKLKHVNLDEVDLKSPMHLCFFINLYHTLLKHALLVLGPPSSRNEWSNFFLSASYEVGEDVFSLAELEYCVIRGKNRPDVVPRYWPPPPNPNDEHYRYAFETDNRISFLLNNGSLTNPQTIRLVTPELLNGQLNAATSEYVQKGVQGDVKKKIITIPQICHVFGGDQNSPIQCLQLCLHYVPMQTWEAVSSLLDQERYTIKFSPMKLQCHTSLQLVSYPDDL